MVYLFKNPRENMALLKHKIAFKLEKPRLRATRISPVLKLFQHFKLQFDTDVLCLAEEFE